MKINPHSVTSEWKIISTQHVSEYLLTGTALTHDGVILTDRANRRQEKLLSRLQEVTDHIIVVHSQLHEQKAFILKKADKNMKNCCFPFSRKSQVKRDVPNNYSTICSKGE